MYAPWDNGPYADILVGRAYELFESNDFADAVVYLDRALGVAPMHFAALCLKSLALAQLGRADEALKTAYAAIRANAASGKGYTARATALIALGQNAEAAADLEYATALLPACSVTHYYSVVCWAELGKARKVREGLERLEPLGAETLKKLLREKGLERFQQEPWFVQLRDRH